MKKFSEKYLHELLDILQDAVNRGKDPLTKKLDSPEIIHENFAHCVDKLKEDPYFFHKINKISCDEEQKFKENLPKCEHCENPVEANQYKMCKNCWWERDPRNPKNKSLMRYERIESAATHLLDEAERTYYMSLDEDRHLPHFLRAINNLRFELGKKKLILTVKEES